MKYQSSAQHKSGQRVVLIVAAISVGCLCRIVEGQLPGEGPALAGVDITQEDIELGTYSLLELRRIGRQVFSTPFNKKDGYGDGPHDVTETPTVFGERPTLQGNGTFLRVNGLDAQSCSECHFALSMSSAPMSMGIGGFGGITSSAMFMPTTIDVADTADAGIATYNGRFINPPFVYGAGGVELLGKEMTRDLQELKQQAEANPGVPVDLITKGVSFGYIIFDGGSLNTDNVEGVSTQLVVRPFGRKGEFATTRAFALGAFQFHMGIQSVEIVGVDVDPDNDGIYNELLIGEASALVIFSTTLERPIRTNYSRTTRSGRRVLNSIGCTVCHIPKLHTESQHLTLSYPEVETEPFSNVYYWIDLTAPPTNFYGSEGGVVVPLYADLKRHDMGPELAESFGSVLDAQFTTARLWGVADTPPYLHDGRALTIGDAIMYHGGEAQASRDAYVALSNYDKRNLLSFLHTLRTPARVGADLDERHHRR